MVKEEKLKSGNLSCFSFYGLAGKEKILKLLTGKGYRKDLWILFI